MADLSTSYMGLKLKNPVIVSSSDLTKDLTAIKKCEDAGAGAVVLKSIFEEQFLIEGDIPSSEYTIHPESLDYLRGGGLLEYAPNAISRLIEKTKKEVGIPLIASINCQTYALWPRFARQIQDAGADGLELNIYSLPVELDRPGQDYEESHLKILKEIKNEVDISVAVKLVSQITSIPYLGNKLSDAGCDALVLFNWFLEPDIDIHKIKTRSNIGKGDFRRSLRWVGLLAGRMGCDIASSGGVTGSEDMVKQIIAGASAVQICSLFFQKGLGEIKNLLNGLETWMTEHRFDTIDSFKGNLSFKNQELSIKGLGEAKAYFRSQYLKTYSKK